MCIWPSTFVPITWVCKKHGAVSHSSTEAEVIALDAALRLEGLPALMLWDTVIDVLNSARATLARSLVRQITGARDSRLRN